MRPFRLPPILLIETIRFASWDRQRVPFVSRLDASNLDNLPNVVARVAQRSLDGKRNRVSLAPYVDRLAQILERKTSERIEEAGPSTLPIRFKFCPILK